MNSSRGIRWGLLSLSLVLIGLTARHALAETRQASVGNYWFEDDARHDRTHVIVNQGDQITFTVREGIYPPHTVDVDEFGIHSPDLLLGSTYTTPQLNTAGTFRMYCRPHEQRGHVTSLVVRATTTTTSVPPPSPPSPPSPPPTAAGSAQPPVVERPPATPAPKAGTPPPRATPTPPPATPTLQSPTPAPPRATPSPQLATPVPQPATAALGSSASPSASPAADPAPAATLTPIGVGKADPESLARAPKPEPGSLDDLIGRREARGAVPWTRALRLLLLAAVPILGTAGYAVSREAGRQRAREPERGGSRRGP